MVAKALVGLGPTSEAKAVVRARPESGGLRRPRSGLVGVRRHRFADEETSPRPELVPSAVHDTGTSRATALRADVAPATAAAIGAPRRHILSRGSWRASFPVSFELAVRGPTGRSTRGRRVARLVGWVCDHGVRRQGYRPGPANSTTQMQPLTFTITKVSGATVPEMRAGGSLVPSANGTYITTSPGATTNTESAKRPQLRLVK